MYHNWYELYVITRQAQKDLYRRAEEARRAEAARKSRKEERKQARARRSAPPVREDGSEGMRTSSAA
jgi:hypothetical protein